MVYGKLRNLVPAACGTAPGLHLDEDDLIPALWHEEPVCLRDYPADSSSWDEVQYDEATGLPITKDG